MCIHRLRYLRMRNVRVCSSPGLWKKVCSGPAGGILPPASGCNFASGGKVASMIWTGKSVYIQTYKSIQNHNISWKTWELTRTRLQIRIYYLFQYLTGFQYFIHNACSVCTTYEPQYLSFTVKIESTYLYLSVCHMWFVAFFGTEYVHNNKHLPSQGI